MSKVIPKRVTAQIEGDFVVFLIGMRINKLWKVHKWLPVFRAMPRMIRELEQHPESGFLGHIMSLGVIVQYWRSFDDLEAYARNADQLHWPAWVDFNKRIGGSRGDVGIWHETYRVGTRRTGSAPGSTSACTPECHPLVWRKRARPQTPWESSSRHGVGSRVTETGGPSNEPPSQNEASHELGSAWRRR